MIRELTPEDIEIVKKDTISRGILAKEPERIYYNYACEHDGKLLGIGGIQMINLYTAWVWVDFTHYAEIYPLILLRDVHRAITEIRDKMGVKRLQAYVECDFEAGIKMVEKLGFVRESSMAAFAGKNDAYMYVRFL